MDRRELLGAVGVASLGVLAAGTTHAHAADDNDHHHHMDKTHDDCMKTCGACAAECNMMAHHCMEKICAGEGPLKLHAKAHSLAMDCQAFCVLSATLIARSSDLMAYACSACADACRDCAAECAKAQDDAAMKACAEKCRECERSCRQMVAAMKTKTGDKAGAR